MKTPLKFLCLLLLYSCSSKVAIKVSPAWQRYENVKNGYEIFVPPLVIGKNSPQDEWVGFGTYSPLLKKPETGDFTLSIKTGSELPVDINCSPAFTGVSKVISLSQSKEKWGRVDAYDRGIEEGEVGPNALCMPPFPPTLQERILAAPPCIPDQKGEFKTDCTKQLRDYERKQGLYSAYALCAEKDGKTVVICISQMKDDPKMAEDIFQTFRWTK